MAVEKIDIQKFLELSKQHIVIDVRSPAEYNHAHIPMAVSLPLFTDEERKIVGTVYKQQGRGTAVKIGLDLFGTKTMDLVEMVESMVRSSGSGATESEGRVGTSKTLLIYCWRGGMRSAGVAWLMDSCGFKVYTLTGGYKRFRNHVLGTFRLPFRFNVLGGYTGSGKTDMLKALKRQGETIIDLEEIAQHKGSAFGNIGSLKQPSQEMFENVLAQELRQTSMIGGSPFQRAGDLMTNNSKIIWLEDESQRIGDLNIPTELWKTMRLSPVYFLEISFEERLTRILAEYGNLPKDQLINAIARIQRRLGGLETKNAINFLLEDNTKESFRILLKYYDKWYVRSLHNRDDLNSLLRNVACETAGLQNTKVLR